jgi:Domain of unknown function (DUF4263)
VAVSAEETDPIVLRESVTRRLVFKAMIVDKPGAPVRGCFVWQRKRAADEWEDITGETLAKLKAGEGYALELHSDEVTTLLQGIEARKGIYEQHGIVFGQRDYVAETDLPEVVRKILEEPDSELAKALQTLDPAELLSLGRSVDISKLDALLEEWDANQEAYEDAEDFWQDLLKRNAWVFSQLTGSPVVLLRERAYIGGKGISNVGGGVVDYLVQNELTDNVSLVEIKTPGAELCGREYRTGTYPPSNEVVGGVVQVLGYRDTFMHEIRNLRGTTEVFQANNPRCNLIVGSVTSLAEEAKKSFELFRTAQSGVQIVSFDEVRARLQSIRDVLAVDDADSGQSTPPNDS